MQPCGQFGASWADDLPVKDPLRTYGRPHFLRTIWTQRSLNSVSLAKRTVIPGDVAQRAVLRAGVHTVSALETTCVLASERTWRFEGIC
jgi:hypothetical protein